MRRLIGRIGRGDPLLSLPVHLVARPVQVEPCRPRPAELVICDQAIDITYIPTWEGWLYLAVLLDACSRRVVGWAMAEHLAAN